MTHTKTLTLLVAGLALAGAASATTDFAFDYYYDGASVQTEEGAAKVFEDLQEQVSAECENQRIFPRELRSRLAKPCVSASLTRAVNDIDTPAMDKVFEDWKANH